MNTADAVPRSGQQSLAANDFFKQVAFQSNANHPLAESTDYIKFEGM